MSRFICLDTSVLIKVLLDEEGSEKAVTLMQKAINEGQILVLPSFAWAEIGSVLRKKVRRKELTDQVADGLWQEFRHFQGVEYLTDELLMDRAWKISRYFNLPTLYDSAFLATAEVVTEKTGETCEFWTSDERLVNVLEGRRNYVKYLKGG